jgi:hypothetical protein
LARSTQRIGCVGVSAIPRPDRCNVVKADVPPSIRSATLDRVEEHEAAADAGLRRRMGEPPLPELLDRVRANRPKARLVAAHLADHLRGPQGDNDVRDRCEAALEPDPLC